MCFLFHIWIPVIFSCYFVLAEGTAAKGPASKKQRQEKHRNRKEKGSQHTFTHQLLASTLKVLWNRTTMWNATLGFLCVFASWADADWFDFPLLTFQSHSGNVTCVDFSSNGKYLASCADDRTVRIWSTKDFLEREHKCLRANVELDDAILVRFSPDSRSALLRTRTDMFGLLSYPNKYFDLALYFKIRD